MSGDRAAGGGIRLRMVYRRIRRHAPCAGIVRDRTRRKGDRDKREAQEPQDQNPDHFASL